MFFFLVIFCGQKISPFMQIFFPCFLFDSMNTVSEMYFQICVIRISFFFKLQTANKHIHPLL